MRSSLRGVCVGVVQGSSSLAVVTTSSPACPEASEPVIGEGKITLLFLDERKVATCVVEIIYVFLACIVP